MLRPVIAFAVLLVAPLAAAQTPSPYAGQESRSIASLSDQDIADISAGRGWGLAKAAELNGYPGPRHVLDLAQQLALTPEQADAVEDVFRRMQRDAVASGQQYLSAERALDSAFRSGAVDAGALSRISDDAGRAHAALRAVHLAAHIETKALLTSHQIMLYKRLRGYDGGALAGHDGSHTGHHGH
jgi:Spy/CpxP family protein refolding chaperone